MAAPPRPLGAFAPSEAGGAAPPLPTQSPRARGRAKGMLEVGEGPQQCTALLGPRTVHGRGSGMPQHECCERDKTPIHKRPYG
jgi:hypothetical protein